MYHWLLLYVYSPSLFHEIKNEKLLENIFFSNVPPTFGQIYFKIIYVLQNKLIIIKHPFMKKNSLYFLKKCKLKTLLPMAEINMYILCSYSFKLKFSLFTKNGSHYYNVEMFTLVAFSVNLYVSWTAYTYTMMTNICKFCSTALEIGLTSATDVCPYWLKSHESASNIPYDH